MSTVVSGQVAEDVYDVVILGAGPVGQTVAERARAAGLSVAVVERELVGGECSYWGCIPSKALLRPVIAVADARRVNGARQAVTGPLDAPAVFGRRDRYVTSWDDAGQADWVKNLGAELVRGHGRLDGSRRVAVVTPDDKLVVLTARHAVGVCTGNRAAMPDLSSIAEARPWTNRNATDSSEVPERLAVIGGGPGVSVSELRRPLPTEPVTLLLNDGAEIEADEVLFATGRTPNTDDIGL